MIIASITTYLVVYYVKIAKLTTREYPSILTATLQINIHSYLF